MPLLDDRNILLTFYKDVRTVLATETQGQASDNEPEGSPPGLQFLFSQKEDPLGPINPSPSLYFSRCHL